MIPRDGQSTLDQVADIVSSASVELGIPDVCEVRSVVIGHSDGRWMNHYTVLWLGISPEQYTENTTELRAGAVKLLRRQYLASSLTNRVQLLKALTSWQQDDMSGLFQEPVNTTHNGSENRWSKVPCWMFEAYDTRTNSRDFSGPRGPFKNLESGFFAEDLGAAVRSWTLDPTSQDSSVRNIYRIVVPDQRGFIKHKSVEGSRLVISVDGSKLDRLTCALAAEGEQRTLRTVVDGKVEFTLPSPSASWEVYVFDDSDSWCDRYYHREPLPAGASVSALFSGGAHAATADKEDERTLLEKTEAFQNILVLYATGESGDEEEFGRLRQELLADQTISSMLPRFVKSCRSLKEFWGFIQPRYKTYKGRREYLWNEFRPLLESLEGTNRSPADRPVSEVLKRFDPDSVHDVWRRALERRLTDPEGAVTMARTLLETVCKHILEEAQAKVPEDADLPHLYRVTAATLNIAPSQHTEKVFKQILGGATSVVEGLGALRNRLGDAHGKGKQPVKPAPRHASLAVNLAGAIATFLVETWQAKQEGTSLT